MRLGFCLSCEEYRPDQLLEQARQAEQAGFASLWISDHFHPWTDAQGSSPFVWSMIGALSQTVRLPVTVAVTCPTVRIHPAIIAQAAATSAVLTRGRFVLGVGTGEALNESILGGPWPDAARRLDMLTEAIEVIRKLWTGEVLTHRGEHYTVQHARIYTLPDRPPPIYMSGFGPKASRLAGQIADGFITTRSDAGLVEQFRGEAGPGKPVVGSMKACFGEDEARARRTAHRMWPTSGIPGELGQVLPTPAHFEQASSLVTEEMVSGSIVCGADPDRYLAQIDEYAEAGFDELCVTPTGPYYAEMIDFFARRILPRWSATHQGPDAGRSRPGVDAYQIAQLVH